MTAIRDFSTAVQETQHWVDDFMHRLGWHDRERAYAALLAALHAIRDCLGRDEAVHVAASMPPLLRGLYFDGWHPSGHVASRTLSTFLQRVHDGVHRDPAVDAEQVAKAAFALIAEHLPAAELESAKAATPTALHNLWPS
jgi:uncharacterized protein (DUF2267 family)